MKSNGMNAGKEVRSVLLPLLVSFAAGVADFVRLRSPHRPSQSDSPAVPRLRQLSLQACDRQKIDVSAGADDQGGDCQRWSDGPRPLEAGSEERVDALKDLIFLASELQHPRSSLPYWISLLLRCGLLMCSWRLRTCRPLALVLQGQLCLLAMWPKLFPQLYNTNTAARQVTADMLRTTQRVERGGSVMLCESCQEQQQKPRCSQSGG